MSAINHLSALLALISITLFSSPSQAQWTQKSDGLEGCPIAAVHSDGNAIYAATSVGVYGSTLTGNSWVFMNGPASPFSQYLNVNCIVGTSDNLLAGTPYGVMRSQNGGQTWTALRTGLQRGIRSMLVYNNKLYAGANSGGVYRSDNNGESWTAMNNGLPASSGVYAIERKDDIIYIATSDGVYQSADEGTSWQEIHPENDLRLTTTIIVKDNTLFAGSSNAELHISTHDGAAWSTWSNAMTGIAANTDIHALVVHGTDVYAGTNVGLYRYNAAGGDWGLMQNDALNGLPVTSLHSSETDLLVGTTDGVYHSSDKGNSWDIRKSGLSCTQVSRFVPYHNKLFAETDNGLFARDGSAWSQVNKIPLDNVTGFNDKLFASAGSGVQVSDDEGVTWKSASVGLPADPVIGTMAANGDHLFAGVWFTTTSMYVSSNEGVSWTPADTGLPENRLPTVLAVMNGIVYTAMGALVYKSTDNGTTWVSSSTGLPPDDGSSTISFLKVHNNELYAGFCCNRGLFRKGENDLSWMAVNNGFPTNTDLFAMEATETSLFIGGRISQGQFGVYMKGNPDVPWTATNVGLPMYQNNALTVYENQLFGGFRGDKSVWSMSILPGPEQEEEEEEEDITGIGSLGKGSPHSYCLEMGVKAYPSPAYGYINIDAGEHGKYLKEITISDVTGKPVYHMKGSSSGAIALDISDYAAGMYIVRVSDGKEVCHMKVVKQ